MVTLPAALLPTKVARLGTFVTSEPAIVTAALMLRTLADPLPETVAVVSISVSSIEVGAALAGPSSPRWLSRMMRRQTACWRPSCSTKKECEPP
jgi:hypothetical protein